ncbi:8-oxoguanine glycosylase ogg1 [Aspergillus nanangensis]|uniref:DNA-(apurinic or apyrimidinic site) lyase n=1 Tax=Aspergillus nanangensis TaxID=2582783 RepID=A0AAD4CYD4_ASPNN|nr:8-oxoguanine glycosylase ogg1 [Aspergillus nanangensis]
MSIGVFSEWRKLPVSLSELCINTTLRCGQSFRWHKVPPKDTNAENEDNEWRCVLRGRLFSLKQSPTDLYYRTYLPPSPPTTTTPTDELEKILRSYFNLTPNLTSLYSQWSSQDPNFRKKAPQFTGIRILRQDAWEALVSFICSSNNNIARIAQMVEKLCLHYGPFVAEVDGRKFHDFPTPEALTGEDVEEKLRALGFGYRAKYIWRTAVIVSQEREGGLVWLEGLRNPESAVDVEGKDVNGGEMKPEGRDGYRHAHEQLLELQGVGPKVADCVCLMGLGWGEAVPVDTHVWQIAQRDYKFGKGAHKSLTKVTYDAVGNHFRKLWGKEAGWAHSVLFTADLRTFSDRLVVKKEVKVQVKDEDEEVKVKMEIEEVKIKSEIEEVVTVKRAPSEDEKDIKDVKRIRRTSTRLRNR